MNTVSVKKTSNIQVVEIQIMLQDGHHLLNCNKIHEKLQAFVGSDNQSSDKPGCIVVIYSILLSSSFHLDNYLSSLIFSFMVD